MLQGAEVKSKLAFGGGLAERSTSFSRNLDFQIHLGNPFINMQILTLSSGLIKMDSFP